MAFLALGASFFVMEAAAGKAPVPTASSRYNSQTIALLAPGADGLAAAGGADLAIVDASALQADPSVLADHELGPDSDQISLYVVREGDTLSEIAQMFNVSVNTIVWANDLAGPTAIREGQMLSILPITGVRHTVATGDTIASIAKKYGGDGREIEQYNGLESSAKLAVGTLVIVPDGEEAAAPPRRGSTRAGPSGPVISGYYVWPVPGGRQTQGLHGYNGIDIGAPIGTPIVAAAAGKVIISRTGGWHGGYGNYVVLQHANGTQTLYAHNSRNIVGVGATVEQGQVIAYVGSTGNSTGPHTHFETRSQRGNPLNKMGVSY